MANKNFKSGLDMLIQSSKEVEDVKEVEEVEEVMFDRERKITITVPDSLKRRIKNYCAANDITMKELFIRSVNRELRIKSEE